MKDLEIKTELQVLKPVFEAIVDPAKMSDYLIAKGSGHKFPGMPQGILRIRH